MSDFSFKKNFRLRSRLDFLYLKEGSYSEMTKNIAVYYRRSRLGKVETRLGFVVSRKVGNAVTRNRLKRKLREIFRLSSLKQEGLDALVVVHHSVTKRISSRVEREKVIVGDFLKLLGAASTRFAFPIKKAREKN